MISINKDKVEVDGSVSELTSDLTIIIYTLLDNGLTIEDVKFAIELGLVPKENRYDYTMQKIELMLKEMMEDK